MVEYLVLICATFLSKKDVNRSYGQAKICNKNTSNVCLYFLPLYFQIVNMNHLNSNQLFTLNAVLVLICATA